MLSLAGKQYPDAHLPLMLPFLALFKFVELNLAGPGVVSIMLLFPLVSLTLFLAAQITRSRSGDITKLASIGPGLFP